MTINSFTAGEGNLSRFYADSVSRELQQELEGIGSIELIQLTSIWDLEVLPDSANQLISDVDYVLTGEVCANGDAIAVDARLRNGQSDTIIWQESFTAVPDDFLDLQHRLTLAVLSELELASSDQGPLVQPATTDRIAYRNYLFGQDLLRRGEESDVNEPIERFEAALAIDNNFGLAVVCRANLELFQLTRGT
ncbi:MAG: TolB-like protein [Candidatus Azotimanducaceae bacterium]|jgi:TolB-like protein